MAIVPPIDISYQLVPHTLDLGPAVWRVLAKCHDIRNLGEYEGDLNIDERIVTDLLAACQAVASKLDLLVPTKLGTASTSKPAQP